MNFSNLDIILSSYERQGASPMYGGSTEPRPGSGVFGLLMKAVIVLVIVIVIFVIQQLSSSNKDDVNYSGLGINYRFQKQDDWIYYAEYNFSDYPGTLYRVSSDGEETMKIVDSDVDLFVLYNNQIIYITHSDNDEWILHTIDKDGSNDRILHQFKDISSRIIKMDVVEGQCYALDIGNRLHIIELDSGEVCEFNNEVTDFCIDGEWIYYLEAKPESDKVLVQLWRVDFDGTRYQQLMSSYVSALDYSDRKIYYIDDKDGDIYSIDFFGEQGQKIIESEGVFFLKVIGDWIYYGNKDESPSIYKVKKNGEQNQKIDDYGMRLGFSIYFTCILDNWVWYGDMDYRYTSFHKMIRINDKYNTDDVIEDILKEMTPSWEIRKYE